MTCRIPQTRYQEHLIPVQEQALLQIASYKQLSFTKSLGCLNDEQSNKTLHIVVKWLKQNKAAKHMQGCDSLVLVRKITAHLALTIL